MLNRPGTNRKSSRRTPKVQVGMSDEDVVERAARIMGCTVWSYQPPGGNRKRVYRARVEGGRALRVAKAVLPYMGLRRSARIKELLDSDFAKANRWD